METTLTFYHEKSLSKKRFIACYIDDDFFQTDFRLRATKQVDTGISEIDKQLPKYIEAKYVSCSDCGRERKETFHSILQEFPEVRTFRSIHWGIAIQIKRKGCRHKSVQELYYSPMVYVYVEFKKTQKATEMC